MTTLGAASSSPIGGVIGLGIRKGAGGRAKGRRTGRWTGDLRCPRLTSGPFGSSPPGVAAGLEPVGHGLRGGDNPQHTTSTTLPERPETKSTREDASLQGGKGVRGAVWGLYITGTSLYNSMGSHCIISFWAAPCGRELYNRNLI